MAAIPANGLQIAHKILIATRRPHGPMRPFLEQVQERRKQFVLPVAGQNTSAECIFASIKLNVLKDVRSAAIDRDH
ncbi:MAG: hypothetical protein AAFO75_07150 [Pseudomonadota bacterium]